MKKRTREERIIVGILVLLYVFWAVGQVILAITYGTFIDELLKLMLNDFYYALLLYIVVTVILKSRPDNRKARNYFLIGIAGVLVLAELIKGLEYGMMPQMLLMMVPVGLVLSLLRFGGNNEEKEVIESDEAKWYKDASNDHQVVEKVITKDASEADKVAELSSGGRLVTRGMQLATVCVLVTGLLLVAGREASNSTTMPHMSGVEEVIIQGMLYGQQDLSQSWWKMERSANLDSHLIFTDDIEEYEKYEHQLIDYYNVPYILGSSVVRPRILRISE